MYLTHLSEIIQFSGWIRLRVLRAEIKIKILNKQEAHLLSPPPPPQRPAPPPRVSASSLLHHIPPFPWQGGPGFPSPATEGWRETRGRSLFAPVLSSRSYTQSGNCVAHGQRGDALLRDEVSPLSLAQFPPLLSQGWAAPDQKNKKTCQRHYQQSKSYSKRQTERISAFLLSGMQTAEGRLSGHWGRRETGGEKSTLGYNNDKSASLTVRLEINTS